jgi:hypothetical protein
MSCVLYNWGERAYHDVLEKGDDGSLEGQKFKYARLQPHAIHHHVICYPSHRYETRRRVGYDFQFPISSSALVTLLGDCFRIGCVLLGAFSGRKRIADCLIRVKLASLYHENYALRLRLISCLANRSFRWILSALEILQTRCVEETPVPGAVHRPRGYNQPQEDDGHAENLSNLVLSVYNIGASLPFQKP